MKTLDGLEIETRTEYLYGWLRVWRLKYNKDTILIYWDIFWYILTIDMETQQISGGLCLLK